MEVSHSHLSGTTKFDTNHLFVVLHYVDATNCSFAVFRISFTVAAVQQVLSSSWDGRPFGHNRHGPKRGGGSCVPIGGVGSLSNTMWPGSRSTSVPSGILTKTWSIQPFGHSRHGLEIRGLLCPFGGAGPHLTQCGLGQGLPPCQVSSWSIEPFGHSTSTSQRGRTDRTIVWWHRANRFINGRPKMDTW